MHVCMHAPRDLNPPPWLASVCRQQGQGLLPEGVAFDLFRGQAQGQRDEVEMYPIALDYEVSIHGGRV